MVKETAQPFHHEPFLGMFALLLHYYNVFMNHYLLTQTVSYFVLYTAFNKIKFNLLINCV